MTSLPPGYIARRVPDQGKSPSNEKKISPGNLLENPLEFDAGILGVAPAAQEGEEAMTVDGVLRRVALWARLREENDARRAVEEAQRRRVFCARLDGSGGACCIWADPGVPYAFCARPGGGVCPWAAVWVR